MNDGPRRITSLTVCSAAFSLICFFFFESFCLSTASSRRPSRSTNEKMEIVLVTGFCRPPRIHSSSSVLSFFPSRRHRKSLHDPLPFFPPLFSNTSSTSFLPSNCSPDSSRAASPFSSLSSVDVEDTDASPSPFPTWAPVCPPLADSFRGIPFAVLMWALPLICACPVSVSVSPVRCAPFPPVSSPTTTALGTPPWLTSCCCSSPREAVTFWRLTATARGASFNSSSETSTVEADDDE
mmetsp:Transcript_48616/g.95934  ORF Transcript_48616/g.95934 Transcript_48616/m.95934 type:complete len:238 (-) Transcript_48616:302-1015(-)